MPKVVLAYSGGLDTSVIIRWLKEEKGYDVHAVAIDLGEERDYTAIREKALTIGAVGSDVIDAKEEFARDFIFPALKANAMYEDRYPLSTALGRPLIAKLVGEVAMREHADAVAHGSTGKGNDQVRFEVTWAVLFPKLKHMAPIREWAMTRDQEIEYAKQHGIPIPVSKKSPYSYDTNLWGKSAEAGPLEDPWFEPTKDVHQWTVDPGGRPGRARLRGDRVREGRAGGPGRARRSRPRPLDHAAERARRRHGVGRIDMVENRLVGIKSAGDLRVSGRAWCCSPRTATWKGSASSGK